MRTFLLGLFVLCLVGGAGYAAWVFVPPELERMRQDDLARPRREFLESQFMGGGPLQETVGGKAQSQWLTDDERYYVMLAGTGSLLVTDQKNAETVRKAVGDQTGIGAAHSKHYTMAQWIAKGREYEKAYAELAGVPIAPTRFPIAASGGLIRPAGRRDPITNKEVEPGKPAYLKIWVGNPFDRPVTRVSGRATVYDKAWKEVGTTEVALDGLGPWETKFKTFEVDLAGVRNGQAGMPAVATFVWTKVDFADGTSFVAN